MKLDDFLLAFGRENRMAEIILVDGIGREKVTTPTGRG